MRIFVNGTPRDVSENMSLPALLEELNLDSATTIVELNRTVVQKSASGGYDVVTLTEGDTLELVRIVGGG